MAGTLSKKPIPGVCDYCGKFGHRCCCMGSPAPAAPSELPAPTVVLHRRISNLEEVARRNRAMWAAHRARTGEERKARLAVVLRTIATDKATRTLAERKAAFEAGGSLISNEKFEFTRPRCRDLRPHGMVRTPIPRIDPSDF